MVPSGPGVSHAPPPGKRKEIYKYEAPWTVYSMNWSVRPDHRFRLALGSFVEEYNNKVITFRTNSHEVFNNSLYGSLVWKEKLTISQYFD